MNEALMSGFRIWFPRSGTPAGLAGYAAWLQMDHLKVVVVQVAQESGQHGGGSCLGIMKKDDAFARRVEPSLNQIELLLWRHRVPVAGPKVGAEHDDATRL